MRRIGEMARDSGLSPSALRFYDRAGVLVPARVEPVSGYRWYSGEQLGEARLLARLRQVGMPLPDVRLVLAGWSGADAGLVHTLLAAHLRRLETGLSDARRELSMIRTLLYHQEKPMSATLTASARLTVSGPELGAALDAVRFAISQDPELPMLRGVLFDLEDDALHVVSTDRYRMAVARAGTTGTLEERMQAIVPAPLVDAMRALLSGEGSAQLIVEAGTVTLETGTGRTSGPCIDHEFPDYRRLVRLPEGRRVPVEVAALREAVTRGPVRRNEVREPDDTAYEISVLVVTPDGEVRVVEDPADGQNHIAVNRAFLLDALTAGTCDRLLLEVAGPVAPLAIRRPDTGHSFSLLMPVRLEK